MIITSVITLDGHKYAVLSDTYTRTWVRQYSFGISAAFIHVNFVDRGPGIRSYKMTLLLMDWPTTSKPYLDGVTDSLDIQRTNIEQSYNKIGTQLSYTDPFGIQPTRLDTGQITGVYFTNLVQSIPKFAVPNKVAIQYEIELMDSTAQLQ
jgi:hypothetical protein